MENNPRENVRVILFSKDVPGHVFGVESDHYVGAIFFPGGGVDPGETHVQAAIREVFEETGLEVMRYDLEWIDARTTHDGTKSHRTTTFLARDYTGTPRGSSEGEVVVRRPAEFVTGSPFAEYYRDMAAYLASVGAGARGI